jgi:hypothetical protein
MSDQGELAGTLGEKRRPQRRTYRSTETLLSAVGSGVAAIGFVAIAFSDQNGTVAAVFAILMLAFAVRMSMVGIRVDSAGVKVVTFFASRSVPWAEVDRFAVLPLGRSPYAGYVVTRDGCQLGTFGLSSSSRKSERNRLRIQSSIDELNRILDEQR